MCPTVRPGTGRESAALNDGSRKLAFHLFGRVGAADFPAWMQKHSAKLGIEFEIRQRRPHLVSVEATGAMEMLNAFALACSLGPQSVCIDKLVVVGPAPQEMSARTE